MISYRATAVYDKGIFIAMFGQLQFSGNYVVGGDSIVNAAGATAPENFPPGTPGNTAGMPVFLNGQTALHVSRPPLVWNIQLDLGASSTTGAIAVLVPGNGAFNFKVKIYNASTGAEFGAAAYSTLAARLDNATFHTMELTYKKNL